jgi:hypothetical protein
MNGRKTMIKLDTRGLLSAAAAGCLLLTTHGVLRAEEAAPSAETPEWPCVSRKVLEMTPAQIWDGPSLEGTEKWRDDDEVRKLSQFLMARRVPVEEAEAAIKKFAEATPEAERDKRLTTLFAGVLSRVNDERKIVMSGIERFHKRQKDRAAAIEKQGIALPDQGAPLPDNPVPASEIDHVSEEEAKWRWEVRVFQERQQNIPIACEIPQLIDERAGEIARAIRAQMKS